MLAGVSPLLVLLGALVGLAGSSGGERELLGLGDQVVGVGDRVVLLLLLEGAAIGIDWWGVTVLSQGDLSVGLGEGLAGGLVSALSVAGLTTPSVSNLLVGITGNKVSLLYTSIGEWKCCSPDDSTGVAVILARSATSTSTTAATATIGARSAILSRLGAVVGAAGVAVTESYTIHRG